MTMDDAQVERVALAIERTRATLERDIPDKNVQCASAHALARAAIAAIAAIAAMPAPDRGIPILKVKFASEEEFK
jgi:hypothetical protein